MSDKEKPFLEIKNSKRILSTANLEMHEVRRSVSTQESEAKGIEPSIGGLDDFTLDYYGKLLRYLKGIYNIVPFCQTPRSGPYLILRHDMDYSLPAALRMAKLEHDMGIKATYFVLFSNDFYNVLERDDAQIVKEISELGHEIGLHYYPLQYKLNRRTMTETFKAETQLLEEISGKRIHSIARHGGWDRDPFASIKGYVNANHPYWRSDLFVHDSCRAWTTLEGLIKLLKAPPNRAQLLTHPENWLDYKIDRVALLERLFQGSNMNSSERSCLRKIWLTDPLVIAYDKAIENNKQVQNYVRTLCLGLKAKNNSSRQLDYYIALIRWYLVNSSLGWNYHRLTMKVRKT